MIIRTLSLLVLFFSIGAQAFPWRPFGENLHNRLIQVVTDQMWSEFKIKLDQISQTYVPGKGESVVEYYSLNGEGCRNATHDGRFQTVTGIRFTQEYKNAEKTKLDVYVHYFGCRDTNSFIERWNIESTEEIPKWTLKNFVLGERQWKLSKNETLRTHALLRPSGELVLELKTTKIADVLETVIRTRNEDIVRFVWDGEQHRLEAYDYDWVLHFGSGGNYHAPGPDNFARIYVDQKDSVVRYLDDMGSGDVMSRSLSKSKFDEKIQNHFSKSLEKIGQKYLSFVIDYELPQSSFSSGGTRNDRLIREINRSILQLTTQPDQVRNFLRLLLQSVESGEIQDNRPREQ